MINAKVLSVDGYEGWDVQEVHDIQVEKWDSESVKKAIVEKMFSEEYVTPITKADITEVFSGYQTSKKKGVMSFMGDENGYHIIKLSEQPTQ